MVDREKLKQELKLYLITDYDMIKERNFYKCIEDALKGGVTILQHREKNASGKDFLDRALKLRELTRKYGVKLIINDRVDIALLCDADGVHVGQSDIDAKSVRKLIGDEKILGVSAKTTEEAKRALSDDADYIGIGSMFATDTKKDAESSTFDIVDEIRDNVDIPFVLIGGINLDNVEQLFPLKSSGYSVISSILKADDIYSQTQKWISRLS
ncbi:thiamine phosphate synthase [Clostridioides mangenotii]|uniref:thiamine phosphate synthase n=1 Tax=Metaclostridioides mangenotii TaxID=1540 RepID=UPI001C1116B0|nr:thiamine phosphate synthase [Clostridioides mangenotii]MBU5306340.1 thiamine phosphate synthase [Clostridioides mangenotii]MCR1954544.1 thiamine phosphate synthase [Clostridioides mangenotii]